MDKSKTKLILAAIDRKEAELDMLDSQIEDQLMGGGDPGMDDLGMNDPMAEPGLDAMDAMDAAPAMGGNDFDLLAQKRDDLESDIRRMRELITLIGEWDKLKNGDWSEELKSQLKSMDGEIANIVGEEGMPGSMDAGMPGPVDPNMPPAPGSAPAVTPALEAPVPEAPPTPEPAPAVEPPAEPEPLAAPTASKKESNYLTPLKKGTKTPLTKGNDTMANSKPSLTAALATKKAREEAISKEVQTRVACAHTIAKTMLPKDAPGTVVKAFAENLLQSPTNVLKAALRQTASNAYWFKFAETFKEVHKVELNDLMEDPSVLSKAKSAIQSELKGDPKNAAKVADDRKESGPQPEKYDDGRHGSEPKEIDAGKAGDREKDTVDKSTGDSKEASKKKAHGADCAGCPDCKTSDKKEAALPELNTPAAPVAEPTPAQVPVISSKKKADGEMPPAPPVDAPPAPEGGAPPAPPVDAPADMPPAPEMGGDPGAGAPPEAEVLTEEKKLDIVEQIDQVVNEIQSLETAVEEEGNEELDFTEGQPDAMGAELGEPESEELDIENIFNNDDMEDKKSSLANEDEEEKEASSEDILAPSAASEMEEHLGSIGDFFALEGSDADPLAFLLASRKEAADVAGFSVVESSTGAAAKHFETDAVSGEDRDSDSDHADWSFADVIDSIKIEDQGSTRGPQDKAPKLEAPKAAAAKPVLKHIKSAAPEDKPAAKLNIANALMGDDPEDLDFLPNDPRER